MLASAARLRRRSEFAATVRHGRRAGAGTLVVHLALPGPPAVPAAERAAVTAVTAGSGGAALGDAAATAKIGFVVPKTVGGAVVRNRVRRRLRDLVSHRVATLPAGAHLVVRALPGAQNRTYRQLAIDLDAALSSARQPRGRGRSR